MNNAKPRSTFHCRRIVIIFFVGLYLFFLFALCGCNSRNSDAAKAINYAENNLILLQQCSESLQTIVAEYCGEEEPSYFACKVEQKAGDKQRLYIYREEEETDIRNDLCQRVFNGGVIDCITVHYYHGNWSFEYSCGGFGFGPDTVYFLIQYIPTDFPGNLWGYDEDMDFIEKDEGYWGTKKDSDNTFFYYRIAEGFYYTEAVF